MPVEAAMLTIGTHTAGDVHMAPSKIFAAFDRRRFMAVLGGFGVAGPAADELLASAVQGAII